MLTNSLIAVALLASPAVAQGATYDLPYVNLGSIDPQQSTSWCIGQLSACQTLCDGDATTNSCDAQQLTYECLCVGGLPSNFASYKGTLLDFLCQANYAGCISLHLNDSAGQAVCKAHANCGTLNLSDHIGGSSPVSGITPESGEAHTQEPNPSSTDAPASPSAPEPTNTPGSNNGLFTSAKACIGIRCALLVGLIAGAIFYFLRRKRTSRAHSSATKLATQNYRDKVKTELPDTERQVFEIDGDEKI
ncbi:hypothetical protein VE02_01652 [Pseudogymnoascus sp. 03VT05]|nr:hypothetical protein VE02_01652 [Pseudogymnoascus sp. 03VT05]